MKRNILVASMLTIVLIVFACDKQQPTAPELSDNIPSLHKPSAIDVPEPDINFCPTTVATITELSTDNSAGVTWSSSVFVPAAGGEVGIYFKNNGPGSITFAIPSWSVKGTDLLKGQNNTIPLTPAGSSATFNDSNFGGTFGEGVGILGCTTFSNFSLSRGKQGTAHLDLSFRRGSTLYTVRVNVHLR